MAISPYTLNGQTIDPAINGLERTVTPIRVTLEMAPGNNRHYHLGERISWTFKRPKASNAIWTTWKAAAPRNASVTLVEPDGTSHTVVITGFSDPISKTEVSAGNIYRDLTITCETL